MRKGQAPFTVQDIVRATQGALVGGDLAVPVTGISIDSRSIGVGEAFFAIKGHRLDGHAYLGEAAGRGAACLVVHTLPDDVPPNVPLVLVQETTKALGRFAAWHRERFSIPVVAVTGSNGKTTTKELIAAVLSTKWNTLKPAGSFNNQWGLPLTLLGLGPEHGALVVELGTNQPGEIAALAALAAPTVGVVTVVAAVHTEFLGSLDGVREEKAGLVRALRADGVAVLNADDPRVASMARETRARVVTYGTTAGDVRAVGTVVDGPDGLALTFEYAGHRHGLTLSFSGRHNVTNALAAAAAGVALGLGMDQIAAGLGAARPAKGRCVWRTAGAVRILDDTYNANPDSVRAALDTARTHRASARLIAALGDMLELGDSAEAAHREIGRYAAASGVDVLVGFGRHARAMVDAARAAGVAETEATETFEDTVALLLKKLAAGDLVLVKGSRGMRMERVVDALVARLARAGQE